MLDLIQPLKKDATYQRFNTTDYKHMEGILSFTSKEKMNSHIDFKMTILSAKGSGYRWHSFKILTINELVQIFWSTVCNIYQKAKVHMPYSYTLRK